MAIKKQTKDEAIDIIEIATGEIHFQILGKTPLICNRLSEKARHELLLPAPKKNNAERASSLKHNPIEEFRASPYTFKEEDAPTLIAVPGAAFKQAIASAALDMPGAKKTQIARLTWVVDYNVAIYGEPQLISSIVRSADMNRTPDVRSRAILPKWACRLVVKFVKPILKEKDIATLLGAAGLLCGIGDWRQQKGSGSFGQFEIVGSDNKEFRDLVAKEGRACQVKAMGNPVAFDDETEELLAWFDTEIKRRGFKIAA